jgi:hypothetical protein
LGVCGQFTPLTLLTEPERIPPLPLLIRWSRVRVPDGSLEKPRFCGAFLRAVSVQEAAPGVRRTGCTRKVHVTLEKWSKSREKAEEQFRYLLYTSWTRFRYMGDSGSGTCLTLARS